MSPFPPNVDVLLSQPSQPSGCGTLATTDPIVQWAVDKSVSMPGRCLLDDAAISAVKLYRGIVLGKDAVEPVPVPLARLLQVCGSHRCGK